MKSISKIKKYKYLLKAFISFILLNLLLIFEYNTISQIKIKLEHFKNIPVQLETNNITFNVINPESCYSSKFNFSRISFQIQVFDSNNKSILPSDLTLYYNFHIMCFLEINNSIKINTFPSIKENKYFQCIEFSKLHEHINFGIIFYKTNNKRKVKKGYISYYFSERLFNYSYIDNNIFDSFKIKNDYINLYSQLQESNSSKKLKKLYVSQPVFDLKRNSFLKENEWNFVNIFNEYFCFCKGFNCLKLISKKCKYYFYLYLIDINRNVYPKTDFLLMDFILKRYSSDDVYPVFEEMINKNINAHYLTEKEEIYEKYCQKKKPCDSVIIVNEKNYSINDDFLEKYLTIILRLKQVLTSFGVNIIFINNLFYDLEYITYICIGHGVSYFKYYLYKDYYEPNSFDKLLIPKSDKLIFVPLNFGWKDENLIKFNLPRWDKYNIVNESLIDENIQSKSIFIMFTWRELQENRKISSFYINNILNLLNNEELINNLSKQNITLYFTLHHQLHKYRKKFKDISNIKYIEENDIADCLSKTNLLVSDYSSIIFDMIYRQKPYIIFIPDAYDPNLYKIYKKNCYDVINKFKSNDFRFENIFFDINSTVKKINYYIDNRFELEPSLKKFYDDFNFTHENSINKFINYLLKI